MINMIKQITVILFTAAYFCLSACAEPNKEKVKISEMLSSQEWVLLSPVHLGVNRSAYLVKKERLRSTPNLDEKSSQIFDLEMIKDRILKSYRGGSRPSLEDVIVQEITLKRIQSDLEWLRGRYFYIVEITFIYDGDPVPGSSEEIYMLSDGTIIYPTVED
jgi:hypothetical protein